MGQLFLVRLEGKIYSCKHCQTHLALSNDIVSKAFHCKHGKAYLFDKVSFYDGGGIGLVITKRLMSVNISVGLEDDRMMTTGLHTVSDVFCVGCGSIVGWKYEVAHEKAQKYKEGKIVLERIKLIGPDGSRYWIAHDSHMGGSDPDDV